VFTILVVDDEPDMRFLMRLILEKGGYGVEEAIHGAAALDLARHSIPDLVATDMMMPVMGGEELIRHLRADPALAAVPILAVTADPHVANAADAILTKPYSPQEVVLAVNALLRKRSEPT
jgi:CheY-like chemotaxis protein